MSDLAARLMALDAAARRQALAALSADELRALEHCWEIWARPQQLPPQELLLGTASIWTILAGRGWGKTVTGAQTVRAEVESGRRGHIVIGGPTTMAIRRDLIEGPSGILATASPHFQPVYEPSALRVTYPNGARLYLVSAEEWERLRGINADFGWLDEFAVYPDPQAMLDMLLFAMRITGRQGHAPWMVITTTPRPVPALRRLLSPESLASGRVVVTRGHTQENEQNLDPNALAMMKEQYAGTRLGRQELAGELLTDTPGALWTYDLIEKSRIPTSQLPQLLRVIVGVDPSGGSRAANAETGIVICGKCAAGHYYVLRDSSGRFTPEQWATKAVDAYHLERADRIVAERNFGGEMVEATIRAVDPNVPVKLVTASRGKQLRAEPIAAQYERGLVHHVGKFDALETRMTEWSASEPGPSPDRMDSLVWALTELSESTPAPARWLHLDWIGR